jgi:hypothetical protein
MDGATTDVGDKQQPVPPSEIPLVQVQELQHEGNASAFADGHRRHHHFSKSHLTSHSNLHHHRKKKDAGPLSCWSRVSAWCFNVVSHEVFDTVVLVVVLINLIFLALDQPTPINSGVSSAIYVSEWVFAVIFSAEAVLKMIGYGLVTGPLVRPGV